MLNKSKRKHEKDYKQARILDIKFDGLTIPEVMEVMDKLENPRHTQPA